MITEKDLEKVKAPRSLLDSCETLNEHYIKTRYPVEIEYDEEIAKDAFEKAKRVVEWTKKI